MLYVFWKCSRLMAVYVDAKNVESILEEINKIIQLLNNSTLLNRNKKQNNTMFISNCIIKTSVKTIMNILKSSFCCFCPLLFCMKCLWRILISEISCWIHICRYMRNVSEAIYSWNDLLYWTWTTYRLF